jgi:adenine phosphoribosyltransferase
MGSGVACNFYSFAYLLAMNSLTDTLRQQIRNVPDFPIPGILFRDISPIFLQPDLIRACESGLADPWRQSGITKVVGIDSRGFLFGPQLAAQLEAGFVMVRKKGKLPPETVSVAYELEYGEAEIESVKTAIQPGDQVVIHDDLLATGGTATAAASLVEKLGGKVVGFSFLVALDDLHGDEGLKGFSTRIEALVNY